MKAIMLMFDTLNRHMLPPYGCDWIHAPNFTRLAERTVVFDNAYIGSMPCMPARREIHTGRYNFLHRSWGPIEPFDDSMPEILQKNGVYTHLVTDHQHYWEDGGATYHTRYNSYELVRGQEGDPWKGEVRNPEVPPYMGGHPGSNLMRQDWINRKYIQEESQFPQAKTFEAGLEFIHTNAKEDRWFLQLETFDPHEPFYAPERFRALYEHEYQGKHFDWPPYAPVTETPDEIKHLRLEYAALISMCDEYLGKVLDTLDQLDLWRDTMLIVNTDHGFLLGEHDWWGKTVMPFYNETAHIPLFIWDPRCPEAKRERRTSIVQTIDLAPTLLDYFGVDIPKDMLGKPLRETICNDRNIRKAALFGIHGAHVNCTDGRYVYMRAPETTNNTPLFEYTLIPTHMRSLFHIDELKTLELAEPFSFTKGVRTLKIEARTFIQAHKFGTLLFDLEKDPEQKHPLEDEQIGEYMMKLMTNIMQENDAPKEQYLRLGLHEE